MDRYRITPTCHTHLSPPQPTALTKPPPPPLSSSSSSSLFRLRRTEEAELGIFGAERYYGAGHSSSAAKRPAALANPRPSSVDGYGRIYRNGSAATPTASSVASWHSHSGLLANAPRSVAALPLKGPRKGNCAAVGRRLFCRSCFCSGGGGGGKAVEVAEKFSEPKSPRRPSSVYGNSKQSVETTGRVAVTGDKETKHELGAEEGMKVRITLGNWPKGDNFTHRSTLYYAKKPLLLAEIGRRMVNSAERGSVDGPRAPENAAPSGAAPDDAASDASSDLFELESFSAQRRQRDSLDELLDPRRRLGGAAAGAPRSSEAASECAYAPSEASVVWSVATAEPPGLDRTGSARGELRFDPAEPDRFRMSLLSCRSDKAVSVGPGPVRFGHEPERIAANGKAPELQSVRMLGPARAK